MVASQDWSSPPPTEPRKGSQITMNSLPGEIVLPILAQLSNTEILSLPTSIMLKGLTTASAKTRYSSYTTISLDRPGLRQLYQLCSIPYIASLFQDITILTDRVIKPTRDEFLNFQRNSLSHLTCPDMISRNIEETHVHCEGHECIACNGLEDSELQESLAHTSCAQLEVERNATDFAILAWALRRMVNLKTITVESSLTRHQRRRWTRKVSNWEKRQKRLCCHRQGREPRPEPLPECTDWDMELDTNRVNILVLKALMMAKWKVKRINGSWWVERERNRDQDDNWTSINTYLRREQRDYDTAKKQAEGRERDTLHAFHVWENCLRHPLRNLD